MLALLGWFAARDLGLLDILPLFRGTLATVWVFTLVGAGLGTTRARRGVEIGVALALLLWALVAWTPLAARLAWPLVRDEAPVKADAVVVLLASIQRDDDFGTPSLERTLHGIKLLRQGFAPTLVLTQGVPPQGSHQRAARALMGDLRVAGAIEVVGPVRDTHDEALAVARLAREKGWKRVLLVTSPLHSTRAALVVEATGLGVVSTPCRETSFDLENLSLPGERIEAFNGALHELIGLRAYRARSWIR